MKTLKAATIVAIGSLISAPAFADDSEIKFKSSGGLKWETADGKASGQFGGRVMVDVNYFDEDISSEHETGVEFRRLRLFGKGVYMGYEAKVQLDFAGGDVDIKDAYISTKALGGKVKGGHFKQPFGLEELTSSKYITFIERGFGSNSVAASRKMGLAYSRVFGNHTFTASTYDPENMDEGDAKYNGLGYGARLTLAPHADKGNVSHFGLAVASEERTTFSASARPEAHLADKITLLKMTDRMNTAGTRGKHEIDVTKVGLEGAIVRGPFSVQGEYQTMNVTGNKAVNVGTHDQTLDAFYVMGSYFLTGDTRTYKAKDGAFDRVKPANKTGAWELALRYDNAKNEDAKTEADAWTVGLNYYATSQVRYMLNIIKADMDEQKDIDGNGTLDVDSPTAIVARWQLDF